MWAATNHDVRSGYLVAPGEQSAAPRVEGNPVASTSSSPKKKSSAKASTSKRSKSTASPDRPSVSFGDLEAERGSGGETHQRASDSVPTLTTAQGTAIADDQNTLTVGERGPQLLEDFVMREKIFHFDHERIPERVVHARGYGAKGFFENYESASDLTRADPFQRAGEKTEVFCRFSTVAGSAGSPDLARDTRGFAVKFYTKVGNWDLVGNNIPVFFIQDAIKFPDLIHSVKPEPDRGFPQAQSAHDNFWDFVSLVPESTHHLVWVMSDRGIPRSFRFMEGFGVHTFRFVNDAGVSRFVKFHWKPVAGLQSVVWNEAVKINGADPDFHRRDLWSAINRGDFPQWELGVQVFDDEFADAFPFDILDPTKLIPEEDVPITMLGKMTLNENVDNFFAETEQVAFCTQNIVPGIDFTNDPLLQGRNFSYLDTQLKRLGSPNFTHIPVNAPRCPVAHFQQDGHMAMTNPTGRANYEPNSWGDEGGPREDPTRGFRSFEAEEQGAKRRVRPELFADHYSQAGQFYRSQTDVERTHIADAFAFELSKVDVPAIRERMVAGLRNVDEQLAQDVADGIGLDKLPPKLDPARTPITDLADSPALSLFKNGPDDFSGRTVGVLVTDGVDATALRSVQKAAKAAGSLVKLIAPTRMGIADSDGAELEIAEKVHGGPSVLFDAVVVLASAGGAQELAALAPAKDFVTDAHAHGKFVGYNEPARQLFEAAGVSPDDAPGYSLIDGKKAAATAFFADCSQLRCWDRQGKADHGKS